jgi:uncharacterized protein (TIGR01777 family)
MAILVTGASGFVGSAVVAALRSSGTEVRRLVRRPAGAADEVAYDPASGRIDAAALRDVDAAVHLAGENVVGRWTAAKKRAIADSRVHSTEHLCRALAQLPRPVRVLVSASAIGFYGSRGDEELDETSAPGNDFLAGVCRAWEAATESARGAGIRVVNLRIGVVLGDGGMLAQLRTPFRLGLGGRLGNGRQYLSWIGLADMVAAIRFGLARDDLQGPVNAVAPAPVTNREFTAAVAAALHRPAILPVPAPLLRLLFGGFSDGAMLASQRVLPRRLQAAGFPFALPRLDAALAAAFRR